MRVLIGCEYSGRVRDAFRRRGHYAMSCDLRETEVEGPHHKGDLFDVIDDGWDLGIFHPVCTFNNLAGVRWLYHPDDTWMAPHLRRRHPNYPFRMNDFEKNIEFFQRLQACKIPRKAIENSQPHGLAMSRLGKYTQKIQPWMFGDGVTKAACLWLTNLPKLVPTHTQDDYDVITADCHYMSPGPNRERERSRTNPAIAEAMARTWGHPFL